MASISCEIGYATMRRQQQQQQQQQHHHHHHHHHCDLKGISGGGGMPPRSGGERRATSAPASSAAVPSATAATTNFQLEERSPIGTRRVSRSAVGLVATSRSPSSLPSPSPTSLDLSSTLAVLGIDDGLGCGRGRGRGHGAERRRQGKGQEQGQEGKETEEGAGVGKSAGAGIRADVDAVLKEKRPTTTSGTRGDCLFMDEQEQQQQQQQQHQQRQLQQRQQTTTATPTTLVMFQKEADLAHSAGTAQELSCAAKTKGEEEQLRHVVLGGQVFEPIFVPLKGGSDGHGKDKGKDNGNGGLDYLGRRRSRSLDRCRVDANANANANANACSRQQPRRRRHRSHSRDDVRIDSAIGVGVMGGIKVAPTGNKGATTCNKVRSVAGTNKAGVNPTVLNDHLLWLDVRRELRSRRVITNVAANVVARTYINDLRNRSRDEANFNRDGSDDDNGKKNNSNGGGGGMGGFFNLSLGLSGLGQMIRSDAFAMSTATSTGPSSAYQSSPSCISRAHRRMSAAMLDPTAAFAGVVTSRRKSTNHGGSAGSGGGGGGILSMIFDTPGESSLSSLSSTPPPPATTTTAEPFTFSPALLPLSSPPMRQANGGTAITIATYSASDSAVAKTNHYNLYSEEGLTAHVDAMRDAQERQQRQQQQQQQQQQRQQSPSIGKGYGSTSVGEWMMKNINREEDCLNVTSGAFASSSSSPGAAAAAAEEKKKKRASLSAFAAGLTSFVLDSAALSLQEQQCHADNGSPDCIPLSPPPPPLLSSLEYDSVVTRAIKSSVDDDHDDDDNDDEEEEGMEEQRRYSDRRSNDECDRQNRQGGEGKELLVDFGTSRTRHARRKSSIAKSA